MCLDPFYCHKNVQIISLTYENVLFIFLIWFFHICFILMWHFVSERSCHIIKIGSNFGTIQFGNLCQQLNILVKIYSILKNYFDLAWNWKYDIFFSLKNEKLRKKRIYVTRKYAEIAMFDAFNTARSTVFIEWPSPKKINFIEKPKAHFVK